MAESKRRVNQRAITLGWKFVFFIVVVAIACGILGDRFYGKEMLLVVPFSLPAIVKKGNAVDDLLDEGIIEKTWIF